MLAVVWYKISHVENAWWPTIRIENWKREKEEHKNSNWTNKCKVEVKKLGLLSWFWAYLASFHNEASQQNANLASPRPEDEKIREEGEKGLVIGVSFWTFSYCFFINFLILFLGLYCNIFWLLLVFCLVIWNLLIFYPTARFLLDFFARFDLVFFVLFFYYFIYK